MIGKILDNLYGVYGVLIVASYFLLPMIAWGWWGLFIGIFEVMAFGYAEFFWKISELVSLLVLTISSSLALFFSLPNIFIFSVIHIPLLMALIYIAIVFIMYWSKTEAS